MAIVQQDRVATFLLKKTPFTHDDVEHLRARRSADLEDSPILYAPGQTDRPTTTRSWCSHPDRRERPAGVLPGYHDIRPTTDNRPFFFHTTRIQDQFHIAFGRSMLFGNGLSALMTLMAISARSSRCSSSAH